MPIDLSAVNWLYVAILCLFAFVAALLGGLIAFRKRFVGAIIAAILFGAAYVYWTYYPHPNIPGPTSPGAATTAASTAPAPVASAPVRPANPVTTITPEPSPPPASAPPASAPPAAPGTK